MEGAYSKKGEATSTRLVASSKVIVPSLFHDIFSLS
jgi:hypothetical protein